MQTKRIHFPKQTPYLGLTRNILLAIIVMVLYVIATNFSIPVINTIFVTAVLLAALLLPFEKAICFFPMVLIYFGYTFMPMSTYIPFSFDNTTFEKFFVVGIGINLIVRKKRIILSNRNNIIWILITSLLCLLQISIIDSIYIVAIGVLLINLKDNKEAFRSFFVALIIILFSVYLYSFVNMRDNLNRYGREVNLVGWRINQFRGVRDPNNFALYSNIAICWILFSKAHNEEYKRLKAIIVIALSIGVIITISFSGIVSLMALLLLKLFFSGKEKRMVAVFLLLGGILIIACVLLFGPQIMSALQESEITVISDNAKRFTRIFSALGTGNYEYATSYRSYYWQTYLERFKELKLYTKLIGDKHTLASLVSTIGNSSHNAFIDYLFNYGLIGLIVYLMAVIKCLMINIKSRNGFGLMLSLMILINLYFRSVAGTVLFMPVFI